MTENGQRACELLDILGFSIGIAHSMHQLLRGACVSFLWERTRFGEVGYRTKASGTAGRTLGCSVGGLGPLLLWLHDPCLHVEDLSRAWIADAPSYKVSSALTTP